MIIHAITSHNFDDDWRVARDYRSLWPYQEFYHGGCETGLNNRYGHPPYLRLPLIHNLRLIPSVFMPDSSFLVVGKDVASGLSTLGGFDFFPCDWHKIYDYPVDQLHVEQIYNSISSLNDEPFQSFLESIAIRSGPSLQLLEYVEVVAPRLQSVAQFFDCKIALNLPGTFAGNPKELKSCSALHEANPVVRAFGYFLCAEAVYRVLAPHIGDPQLFRQYVLDI